MANAHLVGLITDTHDNKYAIEKAVTLFHEREVGLVLHGGDYIAPFNARWMADLTVPFVGVFGNNDGEKFGLRAQFWKPFCPDLGTALLDSDAQLLQCAGPHDDWRVRPTPEACLP